MEGRQLAVFGLGRSGLAVARAGLARGAKVIVLDEKPESQLPKPELVAEARQLGAQVQLAWDGVMPEGTDLLVTNPAVDHRHPRLRAALDAGLEIISEVEFAFRISKAPIVGITGTNGKSTTTVMTYLCLQALGESPVLCGNIFGSGYPEVPLTDAALNATEDDILVAEISSFQLEWVRQFRPRAAGITNITPDHQDRYNRFEDYAATKHRIFTAQREGDVAVVRAGDPVVQAPGGPSTHYQPRAARRSSAPAALGPRVLSFGAVGEHATVEEDSMTVFGRRFRLDDLPFREPHNRQNAAMAMLLALGTGDLADPDRVPRAFEGLKAFTGLAHRMEFVGERDGVRVINNSMCTNPDAVIKSAQSLKDPAHLLIGGVNKGLDFRPLKHYLANQRHRPYLYGADGPALAELLGGPVFGTMAEAFRAATQAVRSGEVIMLAPGCASTDQFRDFRDRGDQFRELAKEWLQS